jgi:hypothetical protein
MFVTALSGRGELDLPLGVWRAYPRDGCGRLRAMSCWQYAQLTIIADGRAVREPKRTVQGYGPAQAADQDCSDTSQTVPEPLTRFGSDGWELVAVHEHREGGMGSAYWDAVSSLTTYTFKRLAPSPG